MDYNPKYTGHSWYKSDRSGVYNPYNSSDRISRNTWYNNITVRDMKDSLIRNIKVTSLAPKRQENDQTK
jgi:hypothetical protein